MFNIGMFKMPELGLEEIKKNKVAFARELAAEFVGTMLLVLLGLGTVLSETTEDTEEANDVSVRVAVADGLTYVAISQTLGHSSWCHLNPAITVGLMAGSKVGVAKMCGYVVAQSLGALLGGALFKALNGLSAGQIFGIEFFTSFVFVMVVYGATANNNNASNPKGSSASLTVGLAITACYFAFPHVNLARTLGFYVVAGSVGLGLWDYGLICLVASCLGGVVAGIFYQGVLSGPSPTGDNASTVETTEEDLERERGASEEVP